MLKKNHYLALQTYLRLVTPIAQEQLSNTRERIREIDKILECESDFSEETLKGEFRKKNSLKDKISNTEIGITTANHETAWSFYCSTFLSGFPIFTATASRKNETAAAQITKLAERDQIRFSWVSELARNLYDVLAYPFCAAEAIWVEKTASKAVTKSLDTASGATTGTAESVIYQGNAVYRCDPYNTFFDPSVEPAKVHEFGAFAGKVERLNYIQLKRDFNSYNEVFTFKDNVSKVWTSPATNLLWEEKKPAKAHHTSQSHAGTNGVDWSIAFAGTKAPEVRDPFCSYEKVTIYARLVPEDYGITKETLSNPGAVRVFKLIFINQLLILAEPIISGNEYLPMVFGKVRQGELYKKSLAEFNAPIQDLNTALVTATLDSVRKAVNGGDILFNEQMINSDTLTRTSPSAPRNIPVKVNALLQGNQNLDLAYKQITYSDQMASNFPALMQLVQSLGEKSIGINNATTGNFQKGNRTLHEFDTIMNNSQTRLALGALLLETDFFGPIKEIFKLNYLMFSEPESVTTPGTDKPVAVDPTALRQEAPDFLLADGLLPSTKIKNTDTAITALQLLSQNPQASLTYDLGGLAISIIRQSGFIDIDDYKRTPEELQQVQQEAIANAPANPTQ